MSFLPGSQDKSKMILNYSYSCIKYFIQTRPLRWKALPVLADSGYWYLDTGCFWISLLMHYEISSIKYRASSICPEMAAFSSISAMPVDKNLCNVRDNFTPNWSIFNCDHRQNCHCEHLPGAKQSPCKTRLLRVVCPEYRGLAMMVKIAKFGFT